MLDSLGNKRAALWMAAMLPLRAQSPPMFAVPAHESLEYGVEWRLVSAGKAKLTWAPASLPSHAAWEAKLHLESTGLVSRLFHVNDDYTAELSSDLCAQTTFMTAHEGARNRETKVTYDTRDKRARYVEKDLTKNAVTTHDVEIPPCVHDVIGGLIYLRTLNLEPGKSTEIPVSDGKKMVEVKVESQRREEVKTALGVQKTIRYEVFVFNDVLYRRPGHLHIWLTDDRRKLPVQLQVRLQFAIGTITFHLEKEDK
jgi:hypothetical protein